MAVARALNVISASADADVVTGPVRICGIKLVQSGIVAAHFRIRQDSVAGTVIYEAKAAVGEVEWCEVDLAGKADLYIEIVAGAGIIYLYSE